MSTFKNQYTRKPALQANETIQVAFRGIREWEDPETGETKCFYVSLDGLKDVQVPFFGPDGNNWEFENLQDELGITPDEAGDLDNYNARVGTIITVTGVPNKQFVNAHFGESVIAATDNLA